MTLVETILKNLNAERQLAIQAGNIKRLAYLDEQIAALLNACRRRNP